MTKTRSVGSLAVCLLASVLAALPGARAASPGLTLHPKCTPLPTDLLGPFARLVLVAQAW